MQWVSFQYKGEVFDLSHLHPFEFTLIQEAKNNKPERKYYFDVIFSIHCFSRKKLDDEIVEEGLLYSDSRETRIFSFERYNLSKNLPEIIKSLKDRKCYHTSHGNYFIVEMVNDEGNLQEYEIYFTVSKSNKKGRINLYVQSAYIRDETHALRRKKRKPIRFTIIAHNTYINKEIKTPI